MMSDLKDKRIGILMGGPSSEREISLQTGEAVSKALRSLNYQCVDIDWKKDSGDSLPARLIAEGVEVVWNALHGTFGEDGAVQGLLECMGIPYTGSGVLASAMAMDKITSKKVFEHANVPTPRWTVLSDDINWSEWPCPVVIKPANEGSSVGVSVVFENEKIAAATEYARNLGGPVLVENFIAGDELHIGILGDEVLGSIEVRPSKGFYDYEAKYRRADTQYILPTLKQGHLDSAEKIALAAHRALGCSGYSRVDLRVSEEGQPYVLEVNTLPGMTSQSLLPKIAKNRNISYPALCEQILMNSFETS